jgi:hypothetical protein
MSGSTRGEPGAAQYGSGPTRGIYSTIDYLYAQGVKDGRERGLREGACREVCKLLLRHGRRTFGDPSEEQRAVPEALADHLDLGQLERLRDRLPDVSSWAELLEGTTPAPDPPAPPEYLLPCDFDPSPMPPSIDTYAKVELLTGQPAVVHLRFQRLYQEDLGAILYRENRRLAEKYGQMVQTVVLVLWPGADGPAVTGEFHTPGGEVFRYLLTRLWEKDADEMFDSPATAAFAPLARFAPERLPEIVRRMINVITAQDDAEAQSSFWSMAYSSMGLRYPAEQVHELLAPVMPRILAHKDARTMMSEGYYAGQSRAEGDGAGRAARDWVLALGTRRLGEPTTALREQLETVANLERLEQIAVQLRKAATWPEALAPA